MTVFRGLLVCCIAFFATAGFGREDAGQLAQEAQARLDVAAEKLAAADSARDRVRALSEVVLAYEDGLEALRDGLRAVSIRQDQLKRSLNARNADISQLLGVLQSIQPDTLPTVFLHPSGPTGTARAAMVLSDLTPTLNAEADSLRRDVEDVTTLQLLQEQAVAQLQQGLLDVQTARTQLNQAMANRTDLPQRFTEDPIKTGILLASSETLGAFAGGLSQITSEDVGWQPPDLDERIGALTLPVRGVVLRKAGEPDAAGVVRPGVLLATRPGALVTSPTAATIRYKGPLLDFGDVIILELRPDTLMVLAGLGVTFGETGQIIQEGTPVGLMGGAVPEGDTGALDGREGAGTARSESLYIEVREQNVPQNPLYWFGAGEDEQ